MGLAEESAPGHWRIDAELEAKLRRMGERGDIIKTMHRELAAAGFSRAAGSYSIFDPERGDQRLIGRVVGEGFSDELTERRYVVVDGIDGRPHYAEVGVLSASEEPPVRGSIIELRSLRAEPRDIDRTIAKIAASQNGIYSDQLHHQVDRQASGAFVASHVRRLEAMRREGMVEQLADGRWNVGEDYLDRALRYESLHRSRQPFGSRCCHGKGWKTCRRPQARPGSIARSSPGRPRFLGRPEWARRSRPRCEPGANG
jgi:hypothetical protein